MSIGFAIPDQLLQIQTFIRNHWKQNHILGRSLELLKWQYYDEHSRELNFVILEHENDIKGLLGFIPVWKFDQDLRKYNEIWMALWKVADGQAPGSGLKLLEFLMNSLKPESIGVLGVEKKTRPFYEFLEFKSGRVAHYYLRNENIPASSMAVFKRGLNNHPHSSLQLRQLSSLNEYSFLTSSFRPVKSITFLIHRYQKHPFYKYQFWGLFSRDQLQLILVIRKITVSEVACLRIIDLYGSLPENSIYHQVHDMLVSENVEYIDCVNGELDEKCFTRMGFSVKSEDEIIPNFFEPYEKKNHDILYAFKTKSDNYVFFKGDGDQDRPNIL
jgi:hypothetical protein